MHPVYITGTGLFTPAQSISNAELVEAFNAYAMRWNDENAAAIAEGSLQAIPASREAFIEKASGIGSRHVIDKTGLLDPSRMCPNIPERPDDQPSLQCEMAVAAATEALAQAGRTASHVDAVIVACSNLQRAYPAVAIEVQAALGISGFAFDMNVACSSATFGIDLARSQVQTGAARAVLVISPEICSGHLEWRDRDCHFIFGDACTAVLVEREPSPAARFRILSTRAATQFSNNIRNNNGFLRRARDQMEDRRDMQFMQNGRKVFKEVLPLVCTHIADHLAADGVAASDLRRLWLHQANRAMNDYIGARVLGRTPAPGEQPNILQDYANTSSAGSIIAFDRHKAGLAPGDLGLICSFGAGYSVGSVLLERL